MFILPFRYLVLPFIVNILRNPTIFHYSKQSPYTTRNNKKQVFVYINQCQCQAKIPMLIFSSSKRFSIRFALQPLLLEFIFNSLLSYFIHLVCFVLLLYSIIMSIYICIVYRKCHYTETCASSHTSNVSILSLNDIRHIHSNASCSCRNKQHQRTYKRCQCDSTGA